MQINNISRNNPNFTGVWNNKIILKGLEKISEHGTSFSAGISLGMSLTVRPLAIMATPDTEKENKQYAASNSICSGIVKFGMVEAIALPIEKAVKRIDENPEKFLKPETIKRFKGNSSVLTDSKSYRLGTQILKLGAGFITAVPKSMLTIAFIPIIMDKLFKLKPPAAKEEQTAERANKPANTLAFGNKLATITGKIFDNKYVQNFLIKNQNSDKNIAKHITAATDILLTASAAYQTNNSNKIAENRKKALIYNNITSTAITLFGGYGIDLLIKKKTEKFIDKFSKINTGNPNLPKYIEGINILRPALIFAGIYYGLLPIFSTYISEKIDRYVKK